MHGLHVGHAVEEVLLPGKYLADGVSNAIGFERPGGHLVEQRLEVVVVVAVHHDHLHRGVFELLR